MRAGGQGDQSQCYVRLVCELLKKLYLLTHDSRSTYMTCKYAFIHKCAIVQVEICSEELLALGSYFDSFHQILFRKGCPSTSRVGPLKQRASVLRGLEKGWKYSRL